MKAAYKIIILILVAAMAFLAFSSCNWGKNDGSDDKAAGLSELGARDIIAATVQKTGFEGADLLQDKTSSDYSANFGKNYDSLSVSMVRDYAQLSSSSSKVDEISVLIAPEGQGTDALKAALDGRRQSQKTSYARYSPESVQLLDDSIIFVSGDIAVLIVASNAAELEGAMKALLETPADIAPLAAQYDAAHKGQAAGSEYDYSKPVAASAAKADSWFADALFIGDSRMAGIMKAAKFEYAGNFSHEGLTLADTFTKKTVQLDSGYYTVTEALKQGGSYGKCYIMMGLNELGWYNYDQFKEYYADLIEEVKTTHPETQVYVIGIMPVGDQAAVEHSWLTNDRVIMFNEMILSVCEQEQVYYVDGFAALQEDGKLPDSGSPDGVHMEPGYCKMLTDYLLAHTVAAAAADTPAA